MKKTKTELRDKDAMGYLMNAREVLQKSEINDDTFLDIKYVREACGTAYLAILKAIDTYLLRKGMTTRELPQSVEAYREVLKKKASIHNGQLLLGFEKLYNELHIGGYYRGLLSDVTVVNAVFKSAERFIKKLN